MQRMGPSKHPFNLTLRKIKYAGMHITKKVKSINKENFKPLKEKIH